jgi:plastocyanin
VRRVLPFAILAACLVVGVLPALAANQAVAIRDFSFTPVKVAVLPGESVSWEGHTTYPHSVHFDGELDPIAPVSSNYTATRQFPTEGQFTYHCGVHSYMKGTVYVNQTGTVPPDPTVSPTASPSPSASPTSSPGSGGSGGTPGGGGPTSGPSPAGSTVTVSSFGARAMVGRRGVKLTLRLGADAAVPVRGTLRRRGKRVRSFTLRARPGRHTVRLPGKRLKPGRYTLTLRAGDLKRVVRFRVRR